DGRSFAIFRSSGFDGRRIITWGKPLSVLTMSRSDFCRRTRLLCAWRTAPKPIILLKNLSMQCERDVYQSIMLTRRLRPAFFLVPGGSIPLILLFHHATRLILL